jgi:heme/copper-type cytochrome/quinol oxidase subunit 3
MTRSRRTLDVRALPEYAFGHQGLIWWGSVSYMIIEGSIFVLVFAAYFFLRVRSPQWPPSVPNPDATFGTINTLVLVASLIPNQMCKRAAEQLDVHRVRTLLPVVLLFELAANVIRIFEFPALGTRWDYNAYSSIVWVLLAVHTIHLVTDFGESIILAALVSTGHVEPRRMVDVSENALYWYFVVASWIPVYVTIYFAARWL